MNQKPRQIPSSIERATVKDIPEIIKIEEKVWISTYPNENAQISKEDVTARFHQLFKQKRAAEIENEMADINHCYKVLIRNGAIIGYSHVLRQGKVNDFVEIYILDKYHGQGYGRMVFLDGLKWLKQNGKPVQLEVATYNEMAQKFYRHFGFIEDVTLSQPVGEDWNLLPSKKRIPVVFMVLR